MKQLFTVALTLILTLGIITPIEASQDVYIRSESQVASQVLIEAMDLILTRYIRNHITVNNLMEAAFRGMFEILDRRYININEDGFDIFIRSRSGPLNGSERLLAEAMDLIINIYSEDYLTVDLLMEAALHGISEILDRYSFYMSAEEFDIFMRAISGRIVGIGVTLITRGDGRAEISRVVANSPAQAMGVFPGDILISVGGKSVTGMTVEDISVLITNSETEWIRIGVERNGHPLIFNILKAEIHVPTVVAYRLENIPEAGNLSGLSQFRYMRISSVGHDTGDDVRLALNQMQREGVKGLVLDLRNNVGGSLDVTMDIANQLVPRGVVLRTVNPNGRRRTYSSTLQEMPFEHVVVIVNRHTASAAEVIASALQDSGAAVIVGETTFGKGSVQSIHGLENNGVMILTTEEYFRRNGGAIDGIGVVPCIEISPQSVTQGRHDATLRLALETLVSIRMQQ